LEFRPRPKANPECFGYLALVRVRGFIFNLPDFSGTICDWSHLCLVPDIRNPDALTTLGHNRAGDPGVENLSSITDIKYANIL
jgi:hypothetical protein